MGRQSANPWEVGVCPKGGEAVTDLLKFLLDYETKTRCGWQFSKKWLLPFFFPVFVLRSELVSRIKAACSFHFFSLQFKISQETQDQLQEFSRNKLGFVQDFQELQDSQETLEWIQKIQEYQEHNQEIQETSR